MLDLADDEVARPARRGARTGRCSRRSAVLDGAGETFDHAAVLQRRHDRRLLRQRGQQLRRAAAARRLPRLRAAARAAQAACDGEIAPDDPRFSGFVFKIQSNMDPRHRDQIAFVRVCSGRFERDMKVFHPRTGTHVRLSSSHKLFGQEREIVNEAFAGDVVGLVGHAEFGIGDTLTEDPAVVHESIPRFTPEHFAFLHCPNAAQVQALPGRPRPPAAGGRGADLRAEGRRPAAAAARRGRPAAVRGAAAPAARGVRGGLPAGADVLEDRPLGRPARAPPSSSTSR